MTDLSKSSIDQVMDLIRSQNSIPAGMLDLTDVNLTNLTPVVDGARNTQLTVESKPNRRYTGNVPVTYDRLPVGGLTVYGELTISINEGDGEAEIIDSLNLAYGTNLSADDITLSGYELVDYDGEIVTFTAKATSLAWIGELSLVVKWNQIYLSTILTSPSLRGLRWPGIPLPSLDGSYSAFQIPGAWRYTSGAYLDGFVYMVAILYNGNANSRFIKIDPTTDVSTVLSSTVASGNNTMGRTLHAYNGKIYQINQAKLLGIYTPGTNSWVSQSLTEATFFGSIIAAAFDGNKVCLLGRTANNLTSWIVKVVDLDTFQVIASYPYVPTFYISNPNIVIFDNELHVFSDVGSGGIGLAHWKLDLSSGEWTKLTNCPRGFLFYINGVYYNEKVYFYGGADSTTNTPTKTFWSWDQVTDTWTQLPDGPSTVNEYGAVMADDTMYVLGSNALKIT